MTTTERYNELKAAARYQNTIVLMRCGDFYETYDADAKVCNEVLGLMLTQRNGKAQLLTGFPAHKREDYTAKLVRAGWRVAICDDTIDNKPSNNNSNNSKTTTTMATTKFAAMRVSNVYWFNTEREALVGLVLVRSSFRLDSGKVSHEWAERDGDRTKVILMTEYDPEQPEQLPKFYKSPEDFEKGETMKADALYWMRSEESVCGELLSDRPCCSTFSDEKGAYVWAFIKGQAVRWYFRKHIDIVTMHHKDGYQTHATTDDDVEVPECYRSGEEVYKYNDWVEVKDDGERVTHEAPLKRLMLEPDQVELAKDLQSLIDQCKEAGMTIYWSNADYTLTAVNVRRVERIEYDPCVDVEKEEAHYFDDSRAAHTFKNVTDLNSEDSSVKFVVKKG